MGDIKCWYTLDAASQPVGPYSVEDIKGYAKSGFVSEAQLFWKEGKASWDCLADVSELESVLEVIKEHKPVTAAATGSTPQHTAAKHHAKIFAAKASDPLEAFKHEIAAVEAGTAEDTEGGGADPDDREQTPDELEFEDDDGTLYKWDHKLRKYVPASQADAAADAAPGADAQQQKTGDYDIEAMTFVQEEEFIPTLAAARAAEEEAAGNTTDKRDNKRGADGEAGHKKGKKAKANTAAVAEQTAAAPTEEAAAEQGSEEQQQQQQQEPKGWFELKVNTSVYVTGLPDDTDVDEVAAVFAKCGIIKPTEDGKPRIKLYRDQETGILKGDGLVTYLKEPSVELACQILDGDSLRPNGPPMSVTLAKFEMKGGQYRDKGKGGQNNKQNNKSKGKGKKKQFTQQEKVERKLGWGGFDDVLPPEKVTVVLKHMFTPDEAAAGGAAFASELEADVLAEATKLGAVEKVRVYAANPEGVVTIKFKQEEPAQACVAKMNGRFFGGNKLDAQMWDGYTSYHVKAVQKESAEEEAARLEAFARELEQQQAAEAAAAAATAAAQAPSDT